jgi:hypothetical protein
VSAFALQTVPQTAKALGTFCLLQSFVARVGLMISLKKKNPRRKQSEHYRLGVRESALD